MPNPDHTLFQPALSKQRAAGTLRHLPQAAEAAVDFASNDYLGFARYSPLFEAIARRAENLYQKEGLGSTGSRLLSGNSCYKEKVERLFAQFVGASSCLIFPTGYQANCGVLAALMGRGDVVLMDQSIHASLKNGAKLSGADQLYFAHNDPDHLAKRLARLRTTAAGEGQTKARKKIFVVVEALYSMDGDWAPIEAICTVAEKFGAYIIVDEAHSFGLVGPSGSGLLAQKGLLDKVLCALYPLGKSLAVGGCAVVGSALLRDYLINFCQSLIYSTAPQLYFWVAIEKALDLLKSAHGQKQRRQLWANCQHWRGDGRELFGGKGPIMTVPGASPEEVRLWRDYLRQRGLAVSAVFSPTVRKGQERLRIGLHSYNSESQIATIKRELRQLQEFVP